MNTCSLIVAPHLLSQHLSVQLGTQTQLRNVNPPPLQLAKAIALAKNFYEAFRHKNKDPLDIVLAKEWIDMLMALGQLSDLHAMKASLRLRLCELS